MVKRISVILISLILVLGLFFFNRVPAFSLSSSYEVYLESYSSSKSILKVDSESYKFIIGVKGESACLESEGFNLAEFLDMVGARLVFSEQLSGVTCYYAYSPKIKYLESVNGNLINVHIAVTKSYVKVGAPIIYGSF